MSCHRPCQSLHAISSLPPISVLCVEGQSGSNFFCTLCILSSVFAQYNRCFISFYTLLAMPTIIALLSGWLNSSDLCRKHLCLLDPQHSKRRPRLYLANRSAWLPEQDSWKDWFAYIQQISFEASVVAMESELLWIISWEQKTPWL